MQDLAEFATAYLSKNYDLFMKRDMSYYRVMEKELKTQNGSIFRLFGKDGGLEGYFLYTEEEGRGEISKMASSFRESICIGLFVSYLREGDKNE